MTSRQTNSEQSDSALPVIPPTGQRVIEALREGDACERDLFMRLRPVDRLALHRLLKEMVRNGWIKRYDRGRLPGPVVTMYRGCRS